jgi:aminoglycoside phosphotransferase (APT) family kinase protein
LRRDLLRLADRIDEWLDALDAQPQTLAHGDASPQNLLVPIDEPDTFVIIDWGFGSPLAVGFDLGQLLIGLVQAGEADARDLGSVHAAILPAYLEGLSTRMSPSSATSHPWSCAAPSPR